ncbi:MAG: hydantoinase/oxoprolinase family protein, partial [Acidimicrobiales bacterium]|nr:hydantoinase/oxoprolinase family protein [Acidimicrobiales bacterium]
PVVDPGPPNPPSTDDPAPSGSRRIVFDRGALPVETPVYRRELLPMGIRLEGPVIVEERETTSVIRPGWSMEVADDGSLVAVRERQ